MWAASSPNSARNAIAASGLRQVFPVKTNSTRNAGLGADMCIKNRCRVSRASTVPAGQVFELPQPRGHVERASPKELRPGAGHVHQGRRNAAPERAAVEHEVELIAE